MSAAILCICRSEACGIKVASRIHQGALCLHVYCCSSHNVIASFLSAGRSTNDIIKSTSVACAQALKQDENTAFRAELLVLGGEKVQLSGDGRVASQLFARSVHQCPWESEVRTCGLLSWWIWQVSATPALLPVLDQGKVLWLRGVLLFTGVAKIGSLPGSVGPQ